jgi:beta-fructofuranosidase
MFRDPVVVPEAGGWLMVVGGALGGGTAAALAFTSDDLASWHYAGPLATRSGAETEGTWTGAGWECPQLLRVDGHDLLVVSVWEPARLHDVAVGVGTREGGRFAAAAWQQLTVGGGHYAASAFTDREGRAGLVFWVRGVGDPTSGWMGALSVPYLVGVEDGRVRLRPHPNLEALRREPGPGPHAALDAEWTPDPAAAGPVLELVTENEGAAVRLTAGEGWIEMTAGASAPVRLERTSGPVRILLDGPMIEVCTDRQLAGAAVPPFPGGLVPRLAGGALQWWALAATDAELAGA